MQKPGSRGGQTVGSLIQDALRGHGLLLFRCLDILILEVKVWGLELQAASLDAEP